MTDVQRNLAHKRYKDGLTEGWFWGLAFGCLIGIAIAFLVMTCV